MLLGFGATSVERRETGKYFIMGRFLGVIILGILISFIGLVLIGFLDYLLILFGILTIAFGIAIFHKIYLKYRLKIKPSKVSINICNECKQTDPNNPTYACSCSTCENTQCEMGNDDHVCKTIPKSKLGAKITRRYSFMLGLFRGATPCLKFFVIAPLLLVVDFWLAVAMVIIFAASSTVYTVIGFISAKIFTNFKKYESFVQIAGACVLIGIGVFTIVNKILTPSCTVGL